MRINVDLHHPLLRFALIFVGSCGAAASLILAAAQFILTVITDPKVQADTSIIEAAAKYFPDSALVQARMASRLIESRINVELSHELTAERSVFFASRAVKLAPQNYEFRMLLAAAAELQGDQVESEKELRAALALAPHLVAIHWRLANLLLREDKLEQALPEFRVASEADPELLRPTLNLIWQATDGKIETLNQVVGKNPRSQLELAQFLILQGQLEMGMEVARGIPSILNLPGAGSLVDSLLAAGRLDLANILWRKLLGAGEDPPIWNGSFESPQREGLAQFDWKLGESKYARIGVTDSNARTGERSLRITYQGLETTVLEREIYQLVRVRPGARYRLTCYVKAEKLVTPDGPQVVVTTTRDFGPTIAASALQGAGSFDWRLLTVDFTAPGDTGFLKIAIKQKPQFSYVDPTEGTVWFDDFTLTEQ